MSEILTSEQIASHWDRNSVECDNCNAQIMARGGTRGEHNGLSKPEGEEESLCGFCMGEEVMRIERERDAAIQRGDSNYAAFEQVTKIAEELREHLRNMLWAMPADRAEKIAGHRRDLWPDYIDALRYYAQLARDAQESLSGAEDPKP